MISWREDYGLFWPDYATNPKCHGALRKHEKDMAYVMSKCKKHDVVVQAGGNIGIWPMRLAKTFSKVITFEPYPDNFQAMSENLSYFSCTNVKAYNAALSNKIGISRISATVSIGSQRLGEKGIAVQTTTIDTLNLEYCDAIFLDVEGHEYNVLCGAEDTITKFRPIIQLEVNHDNTPVTCWMENHGYRPDKLIGKDCVWISK